MARNPRAEAQRLIGDGFEAWVLEPSPPAVKEGPWFADDPVATSGTPVRWEDWLAGHPEHAGWAAERWLGAYRRLPSPPPALAATRLALHRLAVYVLSPARRRANGKIALRWTLGGVGTPFFGDDEQVRVAGTDLVRQRGDQAAHAPITTLSAAAEFVLDGPPDVAWAEPFDVPAAGDPDEDLGVDGEAARFLGDWYGFATSVLEELRGEPATAGPADPSRLQLWPEHFDLAFDALGGRAKGTFGASPGDRHVREPYVYVLPAQPDQVPPSDLWNATTFRGATLAISEFAGAPDQRGAVLDFVRARRAALLDA